MKNLIPNSNSIIFKISLKIFLGKISLIIIIINNSQLWGIITFIKNMLKIKFLINITIFREITQEILIIMEIMIKINKIIILDNNRKKILHKDDRNDIF
jgi:hypothetical protein